MAGAETLGGNEPGVFENLGWGGMKPGGRESEQSTQDNESQI